MTRINVSKRFFVTLSDGIGEALDRWAKGEKNKTATLAAFIIERSVRDAMEQGRIPDDEPGEAEEDREQLAEFVKLLAGLRPRNGLSFAEIGDITGLPARQVEELYQLVEQCRKEHNSRNSV